ncbi:protein of unknown function [Kyrpidia spormannii]|uniref:Uncharacterized protein n=2 Tax=Kyrpidia spormannii TaxID=2055160 RepID=A0ACA8Z849_9BACL|nr:protein of unknown function [Kyrpidia spormannii]CAB3392419.1 protein of unknown function [Kyrpidia spormannii]
MAFFTYDNSLGYDTLVRTETSLRLRFPGWDATRKRGKCRATGGTDCPLTAQTHEPDITALLRVCDVHNVPLVTNVATAELVLRVLFEHQSSS